MKIRQLEKISENPEDNYKYYTPEYNEPLLDYVRLIAEKYEPFVPSDLEYGAYESMATGIFTIRYHQDKIKEDAQQDFLNDKNLLDVINTLGYDIEKFWYLILFIYDYSSGYFSKGFERNLSHRKSIEELVKRIFDNIESVEKGSLLPTLKEEMKLSIEVKGKRKFIIDNPDTIFYLGIMANQKLEEIKKGSVLDFAETKIKYENGEFIYDTLSPSIHIWYFAKMFLSFFKLKPPVRKRAPKGSVLSLNKKLLISKLIYLVGLSENKEFIDSDESLKGFFKQYKNFEMNRINGIYLK